MRASVTVLAALCLVATALAQMGPEMGMMGMGFAPAKVIDVAPVFSADGANIMFSRVHASLTGNEWAVSPVQGGMGMMGGEMGMMGGIPGMMGPEMGGMPGGMPGMGMGGAPDLSKEGIFRVATRGGEAASVVGGRAVIQDAAAGQLCYVFQGTGAQNYQQWGIYGMKFGGADNDRWYPAIMPWIRLSPKGDLFAIPYDQGKAVVFFPAQANTTQNAGFCPVEDRKNPVNWLASGDGIWLVQQENKQGQGGGMPGGMMPGMMGPEMGMGMGMGMGMTTAYHIAKGTLAQQVTPVVKDVGKDSMAVSLPNGTDIVASIGKVQTAGASDPNAGIWLCDQTGAKKRRLASDTALAMEASPDGRFVAYMWGAKAPYTLSVAPVDGRPVRRVGFSLSGIVSGCKPFSWSPDSRKLAFGAEDGTGYGIFVVDIETGDSSRITTASTKNTGTAAPAGAGG